MVGIGVDTVTTFALLPPELEAKLDGLKRNGADWAALCPLHPDRNPSLAIKITSEGKPLLYCHAGCDQTALAEHFGLRGERERGEWTPHGTAIAVYDYRDEDGKLLYQVLRTADKQFPQRRPDPTTKTGWRWQLGDVRRVPFRLTQLLDAVRDGRSVCIAEGEKDVLALVAAGHIATCNPGGAGKWRPEFAPIFADASVTVFADKDATGRAHARQVAASLDGIARAVWVVEAADPHKDISAHLAAGLTLSDVLVTHRPEDRTTPDLAPDLLDMLAANLPDYDWLVDGLLERGERFMLTGEEGLGKSMLLRQFAVCLASGIDPVTFAVIDPLRVLFLDFENSERQTTRAFRPMVQAAARVGCPLQPGMLRVKPLPNGVNLPAEDDAAWLLERVTAHKPDVLFMGPLYRMYLDNPNNEETARRVVAAIDAARNLNDCAVMIEAHAGHGEAGSGRPVRPVGSSLYLRWPEFGYGLRRFSGDDGNQRVQLKAWRGPRDERCWPAALRRSMSGLPWEPDVA